MRSTWWRSLLAASRRPAGDARSRTHNRHIDPDRLGNDYGFERVFARQIEALGQAGDVFMGISTSGNSPNVLRALELCEEMGITTIGLSGGITGRQRCRRSATTASAFPPT